MQKGLGEKMKVLCRKKFAHPNFLKITGFSNGGSIVWESNYTKKRYCKTESHTGKFKLKLYSSEIDSIYF